ncbi:unnamed protein product [Mytilus coruscus]|uniref:Uncharacterized protein n=1 Tax=Mytilus coruscus TaxID=42192 RepID=A0A6J8ABU8_MYTCO|nr:unnamed protein product [Mytilus coruscus]
MAKVIHFVEKNISGRKTCYNGWTKEYEGILMSGYYGHAAASEYACVDRDTEAIAGGSNNENGNLSHPVKTVCGSLKCPPYTADTEVLCVGIKPQEGKKIRENLYPYFNAENKKFVRKYELLDFVKYDVTGVLLSDAIRYCIETKGCILNNRLEVKASGFGKRDIKGTYLRITLGQRLGKSPGVPYVLEIWPQGHYSPVQFMETQMPSLKFFFGSIHFMIYNKHVCDTDSKPLKEFDAMKGDITWVDRNWYQTHKLVNKSNDFCATIQCYNYHPEDKTHWPYFDYIRNNEKMAEFLPDSDFGFREMHEHIVLESLFKHFIWCMIHFLFFTSYNTFIKDKTCLL